MTGSPNCGVGLHQSFDTFQQPSKSAAKTVLVNIHSGYFDNSQKETNNTTEVSTIQENGRISNAAS